MPWHTNLYWAFYPRVNTYHFRIWWYNTKEDAENAVIKVEANDIAEAHMKAMFVANERSGSKRNISVREIKNSRRREKPLD